MVDCFSAAGLRVHTPCGPRKSGMPESVEMPAPVSATMRRAPRTQARTVAMSASAMGPSGAAEIDGVEGPLDCRRVVRPHEARHLAVSPEEDQRGPELHPERTRERAPGAVFHLEVAQVRTAPDSVGDERLRGPAPAAP